MTSQDYEVVIVTYQSRDELVECLSAARQDQRIVVVDNASGADGTPEIMAGFPRGRWLDGHNSGFTKAANLGAKTSEAEFLIFVNPDCRPTPETWEALIDDLRGDPNLALVGAGSIDGSGRLELGVGGWEPTVGRTIVYASGLHRIFPNAGVFARPRRDERIELQWLGAPCLAIRRELFLDLGGFDERYFVYNDDMEFGRAVRLAGLGQLLRTDLDVPHRAGSSGGGHTLLWRQRGASMATYLHHHNGWIRANTMRSTLVFGMVARISMAMCRRQPDLARKHWAYIVGLVSKRGPDWN